MQTLGHFSCDFQSCSLEIHHSGMPVLSFAEVCCSVANRVNGEVAAALRFGSGQDLCARFAGNTKDGAVRKSAYITYTQVKDYLCPDCVIHRIIE